MALHEKKFAIITKVFKSHGRDTPVFELKGVLTGKYVRSDSGVESEADNEIFSYSIDRSFEVIAAGLERTVLRFMKGHVWQLNSVSAIATSYHVSNKQKFPVITMKYLLRGLYAAFPENMILWPALDHNLHPKTSHQNSETLNTQNPLAKSTNSKKRLETLNPYSSKNPHPEEIASKGIPKSDIRCHNTQIPLTPGA
jgi:hypothetical protein